LTARNIARFWKKIERRGPDECWLWTGTANKDGYGQVTIAREKRTVRAHRIAYFLGYGVDPGALHVCHKCDEPLCNNPAHLWLGTNADNIRDALSKGRMRFRGGYGHTHRTNAKITEADVVEIRRLYTTGEWSHRQIAAKFGLSQGNIWCILTRRTWKCVL